MTATRWFAVAVTVALVLLNSAPAVAFVGRVVDEAGVPLPNVTVSILGHPGRTTTDRDGRFEWSPDPAPPFEVLVDFGSGRYGKPLLIETLVADQLVTLRVATFVAEAVIVSGVAPAIDASIVNATRLLSMDDLETRRPTNLVQALENVAGVSAVSEGYAAVPAIRGLARGRTVILIDGARVQSERRVGPGATFLDPAALEHLEVSRGPGSVAYGSDALGGVIYARTRGVAIGSPLRATGSFTVGAGVPQTRMTADVSKGTAWGGVLLQAHRRNLDAYRGGDGSQVFNSQGRDSGFLARVHRRAGAGMLAATFQGDFARDIGRPRTDSRSVRILYPTEDSRRLTLGYQSADVRSLGAVDVLGFVGGHSVVTDQNRPARGGTPGTVSRSAVSATDYQFRATSRRGVSARGHLAVGLEVNGRSNLDGVEETIVDQSDRTTVTSAMPSVVNGARRSIGIFGTMQWPLGNAVIVAGGVRGDHAATRTDGGYFGERQTAHSAGSGFASVTAVLLRGVTVTGQLSRGFRDPTLSDRYFRGPSGRGYTTGNPDLTPETSRQYDAAVRYTARRYRTGLFLYDYRIDDLIERYETTADTFLFRNRGRARVRGIELEAQWDAGWRTTVGVDAHVARGMAVDDGAALDDIAPTRVTLLLRRSIASGFTQIRVGRVAADSRPGPTERQTDGYTAIDIGGGVPLHRRLGVAVHVRNISDALYLASPDTRAVPAPGVNGSVTATFKF